MFETKETTNLKIDDVTLDTTVEILIFSFQQKTVFLNPNKSSQFTCSKNITNFLIAAAYITIINKQLIECQQETFNCYCR